MLYYEIIYFISTETMAAILGTRLLLSWVQVGSKPEANNTRALFEGLIWQGLVRGFYLARPCSEVLLDKAKEMCCLRL